jgi:hypothetical protein
MYRCNLCGDYIQPSDATSKEGFGVEFTPAGALVFKAAHKAERHICAPCARGVHDEMLKVKPAECGEPE